MVNSVVIILGASMNEKGEASPTMMRRVIYGCNLASKYEDVDILMSGGCTRLGLLQSEAGKMAEIARLEGIADHRIFIEARARNTLENAAYCKKILDEENWTKILIVSDRYHLWRARMAFRAFKVEAQYFAVERGDKPLSADFFAYMREIPALLWYMFQILRKRHECLIDRV